MNRSHIFLRGSLFALLCCLLTLLPGCGGSSRPGEPESLTLTTRDGLALPAKCYLPAQLPAPGLILVHRAGNDLTSWEPFALQAQYRGYACIVFTLRGHNRNAQEQANYREFSPEEWMAAGEDIQSAAAALVEAGADPKNLAILGEGIGGTLALYAAASVPHTQAAVLLSPGMDYRSVAIEPAMQHHPKLPILLMASESDDYAAASARTLKEMSGGFCELRTYPGVAHGTELLDSSSNPREQIFIWLKKILVDATIKSPTSTDQ